MFVSFKQKVARPARSLIGYLIGIVSVMHSDELHALCLLLWCLQAVAAQLSSKLTLLAPSTLLAVVSAFIRLGSPPDQHWLERAVAALDGRLMELSELQLQQLLSLLLSVGITPTAAWLDAADWAAKQAGQQQQQQPAASSAQQSAGSDGLEAAGVGLYAQQEESCEQLIARLREGTVQTSVVCGGLE